MSFRAWVFMVTIGLVPLAQSGQAQEQAGGSGGVADQQNDVSEGDTFSIPVELIEREAAAQARKRRENEAEQREIDDLIAQQGMNSATQAMNAATQRMADYSFWSTLIVAIGTVLLLWTLFETRRATRSAQDAVSVTREIGVNQLRPWLVCGGVSFAPATNIRIGDVVFSAGMTFCAVWKNSGQSPASSSNIFMELVIVPLDGELPNFPSNAADGTGAISAGGEMLTVQKAIAGPDYERFVARQVDVIVFSRADYRDSLYHENVRFSEATWRCQYNGEEVNSNGHSRPRITQSLEGPQNTVA